ncbi:uncharacterized protein MELLADRAFT_107421 [Melampsora larici-populina 98AG31]|uniref:Uncharacterized protein n=1 Tax=Melampsora larici-populina (strain 98AG31 / pathotype 3-4-7) TaxID=747676 RepID=F4RPQ9_MELLP|nr:uncharacterized protein MELLADRAFT_107421 [Melampsora larici-populina 98AG31]EGG05585.1 hypothetical protein MELLADRAFT_107421 [Melampsora larici-populina 98AG31]
MGAKQRNSVYVTILCRHLTNLEKLVLHLPGGAPHAHHLGSSRGMTASLTGQIHSTWQQQVFRRRLCKKRPFDGCAKHLTGMIHQAKVKAAIETQAQSAIPVVGLLPDDHRLVGAIEGWNELENEIPIPHPEQ